MWLPEKDKELTAYYVDSFGYQELPEFDAQRKKLLESQIKRISAALSVGSYLRYGT
mgnify:CR=1 FL=1